MALPGIACSWPMPPVDTALWQEETASMRDAKFFEQVLGLTKPWRVKHVDLNLKERRVMVEIEVEPGTQWSEDGVLLPIHGYEEREWRHLDTMQLSTILRARVPRVRQPVVDESGEPSGWTTAMVQVPWAEAGSRWTLMFEAWSVAVLQAAESVTAACDLLRLHWDSAHAIMARATRRGLEKRSLDTVERVGLDEKSFGKGHDYASVSLDLDQGRVLEVVRGRKAEDAREALRALPEAQRRQVKAACIDMSEAFDKAVRIELPNAVRVYDKFHISKLLGEAVDKVRRAEHKALMEEGDSVLKGSRYTWLFDPASLTEERLASLQELLKADLKTGKAYGYRLNFYAFWECRDRDAAAAFFKTWHASAVRSGLEPVKKAARTLKTHLDGLLNYFSHRITNAMAEGLNSAIQKIKATARGFRNFANFRTRILFFLGKLDLQPLVPGTR